MICRFSLLTLIVDAPLVELFVIVGLKRDATEPQPEVLFSYPFQDPSRCSI